MKNVERIRVTLNGLNSEEETVATIGGHEFIVDLLDKNDDPISGWRPPVVIGIDDMRKAVEAHDTAIRELFERNGCEVPSEYLP